MEPTQTLIPKIIHYVWVGGKPLTPLAEHCLKSWQRYLPEYEIKRWDESNSTMDHQYVRAMYAAKKWAFVSDYIRFEVLLRARYGRQLVHYFSFYAPTDLLVLLAADVRADVLGTVQKTYEHLGLDTSFVPLSLRHLIVVEEDDKKKPGFIKRGFRFVISLIKAQYHRLIMKLKPKEVKIETSAELARKIELSPELEAFLKDYFRDDVARLSSLLHRNLSVEWGFTEG